MEHRYRLTRVSGNEKTGGIPVSMTSASSCPTRCSFQGSGCYAEAGPISWHWRKLDSVGLNLDEFCYQVRTLPRHSLWRHNQAGDLPGDGERIDGDALRKIVSANRGKHGFTYTHYDPTDPHNAELIRYANESGFTINLSAESLDEADEFVALRVAPVVTVLPIAQTESIKTPRSNHVTVCPASVSNTTCALCGVCAVAERKGVIGFPAHGSGKAKAQRVFFMERETA